MGYGDLFTFWRDYGPFNEDSIKIFAAEIALTLGLFLRIMVSDF